MPSKPKTLAAGTLALQGESTNPDWTRARQIQEGIKHAFRMSLAGQILLGHELQTLKLELGFAGSGRRKEKPHDAVFKSLNRTWEQWCKAELGISDDTANRLIDTYEAGKKKLKGLGGHPRLIGLLETAPTKLDDEAKKTLASMVDKIEWADSQKQLLEDYKLVKHHTALAGGDTSKTKVKPNADETAQQLAFAFFSPIPRELAKLDRAIGNIRVHGDFKGFLHALPVSSSDPQELSLDSLEAEVTAAERELAALRKDLTDAKFAKSPAIS